MPYEIVESAYGKNWVRLLHVQRHSCRHSVREWQVCTELSLESHVDYTHGDNSAIIATDSQKNTVYLLARRNGLTTPEAFAILLCRHFLQQYTHVTKVSVRIDVHPWQRLNIKGEPHEHAFVTNREIIRFCHVLQTRINPSKNSLSSSTGAISEPIVWSGVRGLQLLKTTKSAFTGFINDEYRSLPDSPDRIFSTVVFSKWLYSAAANGVDFDNIWESVRQTIVEEFAGPARGGVFSASVQKTLYDTLVRVLSHTPVIEQIEMVMPNKHYFSIDLSKFQNVGCANNQEVFLPVDEPSGNIRAVLKRSEISKM